MSIRMLIYSVSLKGCRFKGIENMGLDELEMVIKESPVFKKWKEEGLKEGIEKGLKEGMEKGLKEGLLYSIESLLYVKFGRKGLAYMKDVRRIDDVEKLKNVIKEVERVKNLNEFLKKLEIKNNNKK